jgi:hypothetical protein
MNTYQEFTITYTTTKFSIIAVGKRPGYRNSYAGVPLVGGQAAAEAAIRKNIDEDLRMGWELKGEAVA